MAHCGATGSTPVEHSTLNSSAPAFEPPKLGSSSTFPFWPCAACGMQCDGERPPNGFCFKCSAPPEQLAQLPPSGQPPLAYYDGQTSYLVCPPMAPPFFPQGEQPGMMPAAAAALAPVVPSDLQRLWLCPRCAVWVNGTRLDCFRCSQPHPRLAAIGQDMANGYAPASMVVGDLPPQQQQRQPPTTQQSAAPKPQPSVAAAEAAGGEQTLGNTYEQLTGQWTGEMAAKPEELRRPERELANMGFEFHAAVKALEDANGNMQRAVHYLTTRAVPKASAKKPASNSKEEKDSKQEQEQEQAQAQEQEQDSEAQEAVVAPVAPDRVAKAEGMAPSATPSATPGSAAPAPAAPAAPPQDSRAGEEKLRAGGKTYDELVAEQTEREACAAEGPASASAESAKPRAGSPRGAATAPAATPTTPITLHKPAVSSRLGLLLSGPANAAPVIKELKPGCAAEARLVLT